VITAEGPVSKEGLAAERQSRAKNSVYLCESVSKKSLWSRSPCGKFVFRRSFGVYLLEHRSIRILNLFRILSACGGFVLRILDLLCRVLPVQSAQSAIKLFVLFSCPFVVNFFIFFGFCISLCSLPAPSRAEGNAPRATGHKSRGTNHESPATSDESHSSKNFLQKSEVFYLKNRPPFLP
jgi:hypothetical protein